MTPLQFCDIIRKSHVSFSVGSVGCGICWRSVVWGDRCAVERFRGSVDGADGG